MDVNEFAALVLAQTQERLRNDYPTSPQWEWERVSVKPGPVYTKVDIGPEGNMSGKYMIENATGVIFGIKGYGKVHKGHRYGTLDTVNDWDWGGYTGVEKTRPAAPAAETEILRKDVPYGDGPAWLVRRNGQLFIISTAQMDEFEPETQAFRVSEPSMKITDWDDVAGGRGLTKEQVLAELTQRPVDEHGYVLSARDVLDRAEAAAEFAAAKRQPVDPELFKRSAPQWNCVDFPDGPHYTPGGGGCSWCGMTREQIHAEWDAREGCCGECSL